MRLDHSRFGDGLLGATFTPTNPRPIFRAIFSLVPERHHDQALTIVQRIGKLVPMWFGSTLLGMVTIALLVFLLMWVIFGFMDALVLGLIAGILRGSLSGPDPQRRRRNSALLSAKEA